MTTVTMDGTKVRLSKAARLALYVVGRYGTTRKYGDWGRRIRFEATRVVFYGEPKLATFDLTTCRDVLTPAGAEVFEALFKVCPEHGWMADGCGRDWTTWAVYERIMKTCDACKALRKAVRGY